MCLFPCVGCSDDDDVDGMSTEMEISGTALGLSLGRAFSYPNFANWSGSLSYCPLLKCFEQRVLANEACVKSARLQ